MKLSEKQFGQEKNFFCNYSVSHVTFSFFSENAVSHTNTKYFENLWKRKSCVTKKKDHCEHLLTSLGFTHCIVFFSLKRFLPCVFTDGNNNQGTKIKTKDTGEKKLCRSHLRNRSPVNKSLHLTLWASVSSSVGPYGATTRKKSLGMSNYNITAIIYSTG